MKRAQKYRRIRFRKNKSKTAKSINAWISLITLLSFTLTVFLLFASHKIFEDASVFFAVIVVLAVVLAGILFDMIGIAVTSADEVPFHSMASRKYPAAKRAIKLIRNADRVSSFCNDVVGDICGIISGAASALIVFRISFLLPFASTIILGSVFSGTVAAITVGGKAAGKSFAIRNSNYIVYKVSVIIELVKRANVL